MNRLPLGLLLGGPACGLFRLRQVPPQLHVRCRLQGLALRRLDLGGCVGRGALLRQAARALRLPAWFGDNWDALFDALTDLEPGPAGQVLLVTGLERAARQDPAVCRRLLEVLDDAARYFEEDGLAFAIILAGGGAAVDRLLPHLGGAPELAA